MCGEAAAPTSCLTVLCPVFAGSVLQIVSAPGQTYLRPPGPVVMQTVSQAGTLNALGSKPPASGPAPLASQGKVLGAGSPAAAYLLGRCS